MGYMTKLAAMGASAPAPEAAEPAAQPGPAPESTTQPVAAQTVPTPEPPTMGEPPAAISLDAGAPTAKPGDADDTARRQAHEAAEARRKAEWEARRQAKRAAAQAELDRISAMSDEEVIAASTRRIGMDTEKLTRRSMKEAVCEHIQAMCRQDPAFARRAVQPDKSMIHCFRYINRQAQKYAEQEMKDNGMERSGIYGLDVPDGLCFQWAVDYFNDPDAKEDKGAEEKFTPRPYVSNATSKPKKEPAKKAPAKSQPQSDVDGQLSFMEAAG